MSRRPSATLSICLFSDVALPTVGGAQAVLDELARRLAAAGHRPVVVTARPRQPWDDGPLGYPVVRTRRAWSKRFAVRLALPRLMLLHRRHRFDVVHCHAAYPQAYVARTLRRLCGVPYVVRPHGADVLPGDPIRASPRLERRMRGALVAADAVIAQGESLREVIAGLGVPPARLVTINNGVDVAAFAAAPPFDHPRPYAIGMGSLVPHKGFDLLLRAWAAAAGPSLDLVVAGDGPERGALERLAGQLGLAGRVWFPGMVRGRDKVSLLRSAAFFVCPSRREPYSNAILEAMAAGLPVVATAVGGNPEIVRHEVSGLVCAPESPAALATAAGRLGADAALRDRLASGAIDLVRGHDWPGVVDRYVGVYRRVIAAVTRPGPRAR